MADLVEFKAYVQQVNAQVEASVQQALASGQYDRLSDARDNADYGPRDASADIQAYMDENGITTADLRVSVSGSNNDRYMDLGYGNTVYGGDVEYATAQEETNFLSGSTEPSRGDTTGDFTLLEDQDSTSFDNFLSIASAVLSAGAGGIGAGGLTQTAIDPRVIWNLANNEGFQWDGTSTPDDLPPELADDFFSQVGGSGVWDLITGTVDGNISTDSGGGGGESGSTASSNTNSSDSSIVGTIFEDFNVDEILAGYEVDNQLPTQEEESGLVLGGTMQLPSQSPQTDAGDVPNDIQDDGFGPGDFIVTDGQVIQNQAGGWTVVGPEAYEGYLGENPADGAYYDNGEPYSSTQPADQLVVGGTVIADNNGGEEEEQVAYQSTTGGWSPWTWGSWGGGWGGNTTTNTATAASGTSSGSSTSTNIPGDENGDGVAYGAGDLTLGGYVAAPVNTDTGSGTTTGTSGTGDGSNGEGTGTNGTGEGNGGDGEGDGNNTFSPQNFGSIAGGGGEDEDLFGYRTLIPSQAYKPTLMDYVAALQRGRVL